MTEFLQQLNGEASFIQVRHADVCAKQCEPRKKDKL